MSSSSLRDQLLKAGLVTEDQVKDAQTKKRTSGPKRSAKGKPRGDRRGGEAKRRTERRQGDQAKRTRPEGERKSSERRSTTANKGDQPQRRRQTVGRNRFGKPTKTNGNDWQVEVRDMLRRRKQNQESAEDEFNFVIFGESRINAVVVTPDQREALENGKLSIARPLSPREPFAIMRLRDTSRLLELEPKRVLYWNGHEEEIEAAIAKQDEERLKKRLDKQRVRAGRKIFRLKRQTALTRRRSLRLKIR